MTTAFENGLWDRLVESHDADRASFPTAPTDHRRAPLIVGGGLAAISAAATVGVLALTATTGTPPAYALSADGNGGYTLTVTDLATAIPEVNAKLQALGLPDTVVPVTAGCTATMGPTTSTPIPPGSTVPVGTIPTVPSDTTITLSAKLPAGVHGVIAAQELSGGGVALWQVTTTEPVPACVPAG